MAANALTVEKASEQAGVRGTGDTLKQRLMRPVATMRTEYNQWSPTWRELAQYFRPRDGRWSITDNDNSGRRKDYKIINNVPVMSARTLASGMMAGLTSPARPWFRLATADPMLRDYGPVKRYLYEVEYRMREVFARSNLYNALPNVYGSMGVFGSNATMIEEHERDVIRAYPYTIGSYMLSLNDQLEVDCIYREMRYRVRQLVEWFGLDAVSARVKAHWDKGEYEQQIDVMHCIRPRVDRDPTARGQRGMKYLSAYWELSGEAARTEKFLRLSGFREFPALCPRWDVIGENVYGESPAMDCIGDAKALQIQERRKLQAIDKQVDPPMVGDQSVQSHYAGLGPGEVVWVPSLSGNDGLKSIYTVTPDLTGMVNDIGGTIERIRHGMFTDLFLNLLLTDRREMTAREVGERHEEKLLMLGPVLERLNDEVLDPLIDRTYRIMNRRGLLPPPPQELQGQQLQLEYVSILHQAQKMVGTQSMERFLSVVMTLGQADPAAMAKLDTFGYVNEFGDKLGVPATIVRSDEQAGEIIQAEQQQAQAAQMAQMAPQVAGAAKDLSQAEVRPDNALGRVIEATGGNPG